MREIRELLWGVLLLGTVIYGPVLLVGCSSNSNANENFETVAPEEKADRQTDQAKAIEKYKFEMIYLHWGAVYLMKFDGHEYLTRGSASNILHTVSCPGVHDE